MVPSRPLSKKAVKTFLRRSPLLMMRSWLRPCPSGRRGATSRCRLTDSGFSPFRTRVAAPSNRSPSSSIGLQRPRGADLRQRDSGSTLSPLQSARALRLHRPLRGRHAVHRLCARPACARTGAQQRPWCEVHRGPASGAAGVSGSVQVSGQGAGTRVRSEATDSRAERPRWSSVGDDAATEPVLPATTRSSSAALTAVQHRAGSTDHIVSKAAISSMPSHRFCRRRFSSKLCWLLS